MATKQCVKIYWRERGEIVNGIICPDHMAMMEKERTIWNKGEKFPLRDKGVPLCMVCHMGEKMQV